MAAARFARKPRAVTLRQFAVLAAIAENPGASQNDIAKLAEVDRSTLADLLKRFAALGLIAKESSPTDARINALQLTALGRMTLGEAADDARRADQAVLDMLPKAKRKSFQETLQKLSSTLDKYAEEAERAERKQRKRELKRARALEQKAKKPKTAKSRV